MDIKTLPLKELKALAYDQLVQLEQFQTNLKIINAEIAERNKTMSEEVSTEVTEEVTAETPAESAE